MKQMAWVFQVVVGVFVPALAFFLLLPQRAEMGGGETATATPTEGVQLDWEGVTLEQIQFGEPKTILENKNLKIWQWLPDNRRLLVEVIDPDTTDPARQFRLVTIDVKSKQVIEYGRRPNTPSAPVWIEQQQGIAYLFWNAAKGQAPELHLGFGDGTSSKIALDGTIQIGIQPSSERIYALGHLVNNNALRAFDVKDASAENVELNYSQPIPGGKPILDPSGRFMAVLTRSDLPILNLETGEVTTNTFDNIAEHGPFTSIFDGAWSADSKEIAVVLATQQGLMPMSGSQLFIWNNASGELRDIAVPDRYITELDWGKSSRFLMVVGATPEEGLDTDKYWLVDTQTGSYRELSWLPPKTSQEWAFNAAWSPNGRWFAYKQSPNDRIAVREVTLE